jgi:threonine 3-dehydrogenase
MSIMQVVKKQKPGRGVYITTDNIPEPAPNEVLVKVNMAGICGTDMHIFKWDSWAETRIKTPLIIGHEFIGEIYQLGENVKHLGLGQRVSAEGHITCGYCRYCRNGQGHICKDVEVIGLDRDGCFAEFVCVPAQNVWPVHDDISDDCGALFDPLGNAMHTVMAQPIAMKSLLITGAGSIGLFAIPIAKENGAEKVIVVEPSLFKREIALKIGADVVLDPSDVQIEEKILDYTQGLGPDVLLEMSGNSQSLRMGLNLLSNGGTASLLGIPPKEVPINLAEMVIFKGITIHGITGRRMFETWYQCQSFLLKNSQVIKPIITHVLDFEDIEKGFLKMEANEAVKVLLKISK